MHDVKLSIHEVDLLMGLAAQRLESIDDAHGDERERHPEVDELEAVILKLYQAKDGQQSEGDQPANPGASPDK